MTDLKQEKIEELSQALIYCSDYDALQTAQALCGALEDLGLTEALRKIEPESKLGLDLGLTNFDFRSVITHALWYLKPGYFEKEPSIYFDVNDVFYMFEKDYFNYSVLDLMCGLNSPTPVWEVYDEEEEQQRFDLEIKQMLIEAICNTMGKEYKRPVLKIGVVEELETEECEFLFV